MRDTHLGRRRWWILSASHPTARITAGTTFSCTRCKSTSPTDIAGKETRQQG